MPAQIDLFRIIFEEILKIDPSLMWKYTTVSDQLIYLILIPSAVLALFLWSFGGWISRGHPRFRILIAVVGWIFVVWNGWYGTYFVPIITSWFTIMIAAAFLFFLLTYIIHPARGPYIYKLAGAVGESVSKLTIGKEKEREELERQRDLLMKQIRTMGSPAPNTIEYYQLVQLQLKLDEVNEKLRHL